MSVEENKKEVVEISEDELNNLLGMPGADTVMTGAPEEADTKKASSFFDTGKTDVSFLDEPPVEEVITDPPKAGEEVVTDPPAKEEVSEEDLDKIIEETVVDDDPSKAGRPALDKNGMAQLTKSLIDDKVLFPFDDDKDMADYTLDEFKELIVSNIKEKERDIKEKTPQEFFQSLPPKLQYAAKYVADGGDNLEGLFKQLSASEAVKNLDPTSERGQETIIREYLSATRFGDENEIQEEIESWKDLEKLEAKALQFKPKLDKMQEQVVQRKVAEQEQKRIKQENMSQQYAENIYSVLEPGELNGLKLDEKTQHMLYQGLINPNYQSANGSPTNMFGHLIEKHQFLEPNHGLIAEALWLLADPDGYKSQLSKGAKQKQVIDTVKKLKTEQSSRASSSQEAEGTKEKGAHNRTIQKPGKGFFGRG